LRLIHGQRGNVDAANVILNVQEKQERRCEDEWSYRASVARP
jgi:hypothetical protein